MKSQDIRFAMVPTYYFDDLVDYLYANKLATEDEIHEFNVIMQTCGGGFSPYEIDIDPSPSCHKVERILMEHFATTDRPIFFVLPYVGGFVEDLCASRDGS